MGPFNSINYKPTNAVMSGGSLAQISPSGSRLAHHRHLRPFSCGLNPVPSTAYAKTPEPFYKQTLTNLSTFRQEQLFSFLRARFSSPAFNLTFRLQKPNAPPLAHSRTHFWANLRRDCPDLGGRERRGGGGGEEDEDALFPSQNHSPRPRSGPMRGGGEALPVGRGLQEAPLDPPLLPPPPP